MTDWPPDVDALKVDMGVDPTDDRDDTPLRQQLDAAVAYVERAHRGRYNFDGDLGSDLPDPPADMVLGTLRLAGRWFTRRRSPDGSIDLGELGSSRVPGSDPDIDRMLRIGRHAFPRVG